MHTAIDQYFLTILYWFRHNYYGGEHHLINDAYIQDKETHVQERSSEVSVDRAF